MIIVVLATEHPERDAWVDEQAALEAVRNGNMPGPYHGVHQLPTGARVHMFGWPAHVHAAIDAWREYVEAVDDG